MATDGNGNVFVTGTTTSTNSVLSPNIVFPASYLPTPFQQTPAPGSTIQFFVTEVNTKNIGVASVPYSTYFGGGTPTGAVAIGGGIAVDTTGNVYFSGTTNFYNSQESQGGGGALATDFPILNAYQPCLDTPAPVSITGTVTCTPPTVTPYPTDAFVAKLNPSECANGRSSATLLELPWGNGHGFVHRPDDRYRCGQHLSDGNYEFERYHCTDRDLGVSALPEHATSESHDLPGGHCSNRRLRRQVHQSDGDVAGSTATSLVLSYFSYLGGSWKRRRLGNCSGHSGWSARLPGRRAPGL